MVSALWARVLLAMLVALDFVVDLVRAVTLEDYSLYQACLASPSTCHTLYVCTSTSLPLLEAFLNFVTK